MYIYIYIYTYTYIYIYTHIYIYYTSIKNYWMSYSIIKHHVEVVEFGPSAPLRRRQVHEKGVHARALRRTVCEVKGAL